MARDRSPRHQANTKLKASSYYIKNRSGQFWSRELNRFSVKANATVFTDDEASKLDDMPTGGTWYAIDPEGKKPRLRNSERQVFYFSVHWNVKGNTQEDYGIFYADTKGELAEVIKEACYYYELNKRNYYLSSIPGDFTNIAAGRRISHTYDLCQRSDRVLTVKILSEQEFSLLTAVCGF